MTTAFRHGGRPLAGVTLAVGNTPLVRLAGLCSPGIEVLAKCEFMNPGGSVKDRAALQMMTDAQASGRLAPASTLIDSTSGNTGVAYALMGAALGVKVALVMPANVAPARRRICKAMGAEIVFSDPMEGSDGAIRLARRLVAESPRRFFYADQYANESNPLAHYLGTGREIWAQTGGRVTHFVAGMGTGGTLMGTGRRLRRENPRVRIVGVEPAEALHGLEGLKHMESSIVPPIYREEELSEKLSVPTDEGWDMAERLLAEEGIPAGHSGGAAVVGAARIAARLRAAREEGVVVTLLPDRADRTFEPLR